MDHGLNWPVQSIIQPDVDLIYTVLHVVLDGLILTTGSLVLMQASSEVMGACRSDGSPNIFKARSEARTTQLQP